MLREKCPSLELTSFGRKLSRPPREGVSVDGHSSVRRHVYPRSSGIRRSENRSHRAPTVWALMSGGSDRFALTLQIWVNRRVVAGCRSNCLEVRTIHGTLALLSAGCSISMRWDSNSTRRPASGLGGFATDSQVPSVPAAYDSGYEVRAVPNCMHCNSSVTPDFARIFGNTDGEVFGCHRYPSSTRRRAGKTATTDSGLIEGLAPLIGRCNSGLDCLIRGQVRGRSGR